MRFPNVRQYDSMDCGVACLSMMSMFYGKNYSLETLREKCNCAIDGTSIINIADAAEEIGFKTIAGRIPINKLKSEAPFPCVIHWDQSHFVILKKIRGWKKKSPRYYVSDPAVGPMIYSEKEFKKGWVSFESNNEEKGIVLLLEPTKKFYEEKDEKENKRSLKFLFEYFKRYRRYFSQLFFGLLLGSLLQLFFPFLTQSIVDIGINENNLNFIYLVLIAQMVLIIGRMSVDFIRRWILLHISTRVNISLVSDFFIKLMNLPMKFFDTKFMGDILQRMEDHERVERFLTVQSLSVIFSFFNLVVFGAVLLIYSLKIFLIFIFGSLIYTFWIFLFMKKRRLLDYKIFEQRALNKSKTYQLIEGMQEIKLQNCEKRKRWEWEDVQADLFKVNISSLSLEQYQEAGNILINETKNIIITVVAATSVLNGELSLGMMLAVQYIIGQLNTPIEQVVGLIHNHQDTKISLERINEIHKRNNENDNTKINLDKLENKDITLDNLMFQYEGRHSPKVLCDINLSIPRGKVTAIVGGSGSGKTTLIKLLLQYYQPINGKIFIGNMNLGDINSNWWRKQCGAVMQDGFIFSESIARNIAVSEEEIDTKKLLYAAKMANIHNHIDSLPLKYNTIIGREGQGISQGQKQRVLIARAIYKNPKYIFLDEATNALDSENEKLIVENLEQFYNGKTVVVVAHRMSTVKNADQIVVLEKGKIVEVGKHEDLIQKEGAYFNLVRNQLELGT